MEEEGKKFDLAVEKIDEAIWCLIKLRIEVARQAFSELGISPIYGKGVQNKRFLRAKDWAIANGLDSRSLVAFENEHLIHINAQLHRHTYPAAYAHKFSLY